MGSGMKHAERLKIVRTCKKYDIKKYTIREDGSLDVFGNVTFFNKNLKRIPLIFNEVTGNFSCSKNQLTTLKGCPRKVGMHFMCQENRLTTLEHCPDFVGMDFDCSHNSLETLNGIPNEIFGSLYTQTNRIYTLVGFPQIIHQDIFITRNPRLPEDIRYMTTCHSVGLDSLRIFFKYQMYYNIWTPEFDKEAFEELLEEIADGLE